MSVENRNGRAMVTIIDSIIDYNMVLSASAEWPCIHWPQWHRYSNGKLATKDERDVTPCCRYILSKMAEFASSAGEFADWTLHGAGMHTMPTGSELPMHVDADMHPRGWIRTMTACMFVHREWREDWGGNLVFYGGEDREPIRSIVPMPGKMVLFRNEPGSWHSVTKVVGPFARKSLGMFFYRMPEHEDDLKGATTATFANT